MPETPNDAAATLTIGLFRGPELDHTLYVTRYGRVEWSTPNRHTTASSPSDSQEMRLLAELMVAFERLQDHYRNRTGDPQ